MYPPLDFAGRGTSGAGGGVLERRKKAPPPPSAVPLRCKCRGGASGPLRQRGQAHQDGVDIAAGLEAEQGAAVVEQVELDVAAAKFEQAIHVGVGEGRIAPRADDPRKDIEERLADLPGEG